MAQKSSLWNYKALTTWAWAVSISTLSCVHRGLMIRKASCTPWCCIITLIFGVTACWEFPRIIEVEFLICLREWIDKINLISSKQGNLINLEYLSLWTSSHTWYSVIEKSSVIRNYNKWPGFHWVVKEDVSEKVTLKLRLEGCIGVNQLKRGKGWVKISKTGSNLLSSMI